MNRFTVFLLSTGAIGLLATSSFAQDEEAIATDFISDLPDTPLTGEDADMENLDGTDADGIIYEDESFLDFVWSLPMIYHNEENPLIQEARVTGLWQWQTAEVEPRNSKQKSARESEARRTRIGGLLRTFYSVEIEGQIDLDGNDGYNYDGVDELTASYTTEGGTRLSVGKMRVPFSFEGATHSQELPVMERSLLIDQIMPAKTTGVSLSGPIDDTNWSYFAGVFSGERSREFGDFNNGVFYMARLEYDFRKAAIDAAREAKKNDKIADNDDDPIDSLDREKFHFDYIYNPDVDKNTAIQPFRHMFATGIELEKGRFGFAGDLIYATGEVDLWGITAMPWVYLIEDKMQLVARYSYADTDDADGLVLRPRYEQFSKGLSKVTGDEYHSFYVGLNYYIHENNLKLMSGLEYSIMNEERSRNRVYKGWTWMSGVRVSF